MKLAAIYNVFDGEELLEGSIKQIRNHVDLVICISQKKSYYGDYYLGGYNECQRLKQLGLVDIHQCHENLKERSKRNQGLRIAKSYNCSHFIMMDCDEYWITEDFIRMKEYDIDCFHPLYTYFGKPTLRLDPIENYFVPGICSLKENTIVGNFNVGGLCDPTRKPNHKLSVGGCYMHHFSYIRKDINRKINNSSARNNILKKKQQLIEDLINAKPGYYCNFYERNIILVENTFNIET